MSGSGLTAILSVEEELQFLLVPLSALWQTLCLVSFLEERLQPFRTHLSRGQWWCHPPQGHWEMWVCRTVSCTQENLPQSAPPLNISGKKKVDMFQWMFLLRRMLRTPYLLSHILKIIVFPVTGILLRNFWVNFILHWWFKIAEDKWSCRGQTRIVLLSFWRLLEKEILSNDLKLFFPSIPY